MKFYIYIVILIYAFSNVNLLQAQLMHEKTNSQGVNQAPSSLGVENSNPQVKQMKKSKKSDQNLEYFSSVKNQDSSSISLPTVPLYEKNKIVVKLSDAFMKYISKDFNNQSRRTFGIDEIDKLLKKYRPSLIKQLYPIYDKTPKSPKRIGLSHLFEISFTSELDIKQVIIELSSVYGILYAEPIYIEAYHATPNDTHYSSLFHLDQISASTAWDIHKGENGTTDVLIGICDSGVEWFHSDLLENLYQNLGEDADGDGSVIEFFNGQWRFDQGDINGIDDDGNGSVDDFVGWNFYTSDGSTINNPLAVSPNNHGTHVAGIAAGVTNNSNGIASISWNIKFLPTKHGSNSGGTSIYNAYSGLVYLADNGVDVINCSWGGSGYSSAAQEIIDYCLDEGVVVFASAGNGNTEAPNYPAAYKGVISVASVNNVDEKAYYSHYGYTIDISSPGGDAQDDPMIKSTVTGNNYANYQGTSMASPLAVGAFALLKSYRNTWTNTALLKQFMGSADNIEADNPAYPFKMGYGRVNMNNALSTTNADITKALKLVLSNFKYTDANSNGLIEPGESVSLEFNLYNHNPLYGSTNLGFTFSSSNPNISFTQSGGTLSILPEGSVKATGASFTVSSTAQTQALTLVLNLTNNDGIQVGSSFTFNLSITNGCIILTENFESLSIPSGWSQQNILGNTPWSFGVSGGYLGVPSNAYQGNYNARLYSSEATTRLISPWIDVNTCGDATLINLSFAHAQAIWGADQDSLIIYYQLDGESTWNLVSAIKNNLTSWKIQNFQIPQITKKFRLAFEAHARYGYGVCLDQLSIYGTVPDLYCAASTTTQDEYISQVIFGGINNSSFWQSGVADFTDVAINLNLDTNYQIIVNVANLYSVDSVVAWIDINQNNEFDASEKFILTYDAGTSFKGIINISSESDFELGATRMRIRLTYDETPTPCGVSEYGEIEDYTVVILGEGGITKKNITTKQKLHGLLIDGKHKPASVIIELRSGLALMSSSIIKRLPALIDTNGYAVADFGEVQDGEYWMIVRAPGYLPIASPDKVLLNAFGVQYDFTSSASKSIGATNALIQLNSIGPWMMRPGDFNASGTVSADDINTLYFESKGRNVSSQIPAP